jgi:hypothetical protein
MKKPEVHPMGLLSKVKSLFGPSPKPSPEEAEVIVDQLIELGFLKFVAESENSKVRAQLVECVQNKYLDSEWDDNCVSADKRSYPADAEDLAEGDMGKCLRHMKDVLTEEGVTLESIEDDFGEAHRSYHVLLNGAAHLIYDLADDADQDIWLQALRRLIEIVNSLLEVAGSDERLFGIYGGNDARVLLLTPEMHCLLRQSSGTFDEKWMPMSADELT